MKTLKEILEAARRALNSGDFNGSLAAINELEAALSKSGLQIRGAAPRISENPFPGQRVGICVGHSRTGDRSGALSVGKVSEYSYNFVLAGLLRHELCLRGIDCFIVDFYDKPTYGAAMIWLAGKLRAANATLALELHFNAGGGAGHEVLCFDASATSARPSKQLAECLNESMSKAWPEGRNRGVKTAQPSNGRGFVRGMHCPAVIVEPFFGDHPGDWERWKDGQAELARAYADGIEAFLKSEK